MTAADFTPLMVKAFKIALVNDTAVLYNISQVFGVRATTWEGRRLQFLETASMRQLTESDMVQVDYNVTVVLPSQVDSSESAANASTELIEQLQSDLLSATSTSTADGESSFVKSFKMVLETYDVAVNVSVNENATVSGIEQLSENVAIDEVAYTRPPTPLPTPSPGSSSDDDAWVASVEGIVVLVVVSVLFVVLVSGAIYKKDDLENALRSCFRESKKDGRVGAAMDPAQHTSNEGAQFQDVVAGGTSNV